MSELEAAVADVGALVLRLQKYRHGAGPAGVALGRDAVGLGDAARRLHRRQALDETAAATLLGEAHALVDRLRRELGAVRDAPAYAAAVAAHAAGDQGALARVVPALFAGVEAADVPAALFHAVPWRRRGRPRPAADLVAALVVMRDEGIGGDGDDLSPGTDPALPAVLLSDEAPADEPVAVRIAREALGVPAYRLAATGEYLCYTSRLRAPFVVLIAPRLPEDEVDAAPVAWDPYRAALTRALEAAGFVVETHPRT